MNNLVSIITPLYNSVEFLEDTYKSIVSQTYSNWEWVVTDDMSTDGSWELLRSLAEKDSRIVTFRNNKNLGAGASRNAAIEKARGRFIAFLDADDLWVETKLSDQINFMLENQYSFTYTHYSRFNSEEELSVVTAPEYTTYKKLMYSNVIGCLTAVYDTQALGKRYMPLIRKRQDMGLWLDILKDTPKAYCLPKPLAKYRMDSGMTANKFSVLSYQWKFYRDVVGLSLPRSLFTFSVYAVKGTMKHRTKRKS
ncbi:TPA: glycosyltransferase family 2 protein [Vibrio diabolicus]|uniref:glycosyltransferase family 2 protein n=1 Tax=Vibrio TaxID=662 RepID=UPI001F3FED6C|nr:MULTISPECIES: glycosyltransferase family 2 protein [Vibrio]MCF7454676.1 glycosyltransferase [Vibrio sp. A1-1]MCG6238393.1 glycosyltransferase [Vibrio diabolicus]MCG9622776.1 glycosyltransferase [Vibrio diabolicus]MCR9533397.1 glycosyltransferase [Vibrio alginolyticus]MDW3056252.1 glycosyltransferase family 2 protein [Vibrio sp. 1978]